jgi:hypothetical protein
MANDAQTRFHEEWLGLAQPYEGLVFSVPALSDAQIVPQVTADLTTRFRRTLVLPAGDGAGRFGDLATFFETFLGFSSRALVRRADLPDAYSFYAQEGQQELRPSFAIARTVSEAVSGDDPFGNFGDEPAAPVSAKPSAAGASPYIALVWDVRDDADSVSPEDAPPIDLDKPEECTGPWRYPPTSKFERLLRAVGVPIGFLCNGVDLRLVYAPAGESTSHLTFRTEFMQRPEGRPILAAFELLFNASRTYQAGAEFTFEGLLKESRSRQADVTKELASQVFEAMELLLAGFEAASIRDQASGRWDYLRAALEASDDPATKDHAYQGLLSVVLRLVFLLYAEDKGLLPYPADNTFYAQHLSVKGLYDELVADAGQHPESMFHRYGAYGRLLSLFRAVYYGVEHADLKLPPRRGRLFDPSTFPFLEGGLPGSTAAYRVPEERADAHPPSLDDGTVYEVLHRLIFFQGQRLSYASLDVEQLGSVYESLMGYGVLRTEEPAVRLGKHKLWVSVGALRRAKGPERKMLLKDEAGLSTAQVTRAEALIKEHQDNAALAAALNELSPGGKTERAKHLAPAQRLVLQPGAERRRSGSHYTPRSLTTDIVRRTLEPLLKCLGETPTEEQILSLKICDPAMGSGAFLVEVVRQLAAKIAEVWTREGRIAALSEQYADPEQHARRLVAQRCIYGVDKNAAAVELAKLSLWLVTLSADLPFTFLDHSLRHGDSLVGLNLEQVSSFHWKPVKQVPLLHGEIADCLQQALQHRAELVTLTDDDTPFTQDERRRLLDHAEQAMDRVRLIADVCIGAFFAADSDKARNAERMRRLELVSGWLLGDTAVEAELRDLASEVRVRLAPFHWMLEFPEVFFQERPDPLDGGKVNGAAMMDGFVGNPPFMGKNGISETNGAEYLAWLQAVHEGAHGNADLSAHFFRRTASLLGRHGTLGLVATNTIGQGDTRSTALQYLCGNGFLIHAATVNMPWPGEAAVTVSVVHLVRGNPKEQIAIELDGNSVSAINSRLRPKPERSDPQPLRANAGAAYVGTYVLGMGFTLTPEEREALVARDAKNAERIFPYLGGEEVNSSPTQSHDRYVISFGQMSLEEAERWPDLLAIVREKVKPERDKNNRANYRDNWWLFGEYRPGLFEAIAPLSRCLVTARVSKHLMMCFQPVKRVFSEQLYAFPLDGHGDYGVLQSRVHEVWARLLSSSMKTDLRYAASDCFETFPFPQPDPRSVIPELETIGETLYTARAKYMVDTDQGLTKTYNALKDPQCTDSRVIELRHLHEALDRAVLRAYPKLEIVGSNDPNIVGWSDIAVPPFCIATDEDKALLAAFEDEVIDRLFILNEQRAKEEAAGKVTPKPKTKPKKNGETKPSKRGKAKDSEPGDQGTLL